MKWNKSFYIFMALLLSLFLLTACGNEEAAPEEEETVSEEPVAEEDAETAETRTLTDALGNEVNVPAEPERVIASYLEDYLVALEIQPVAQWSVADGATVQDYLQETLEGVPTIPYDLPYEAVASFDPDLIIIDAASMVEGNKYEQYSRIAPTYVIGSEENNDWREELLQIGEVFGETDKAEEVLAEYEQKAEEAREQIEASAGGESAAAIWLVNNTFFVVSENLSSGDVLYGDLGLEVPEVVQEISESSVANWSEISLEKLAELDADHIFLVNSDQGTGSEMLEDPIWQNIPAVQNGNIYEFEADTSWLYTGPIASSQMIDDVTDSLVE